MLPETLHAIYAKVVEQVLDTDREGMRRYGSQKNRQITFKQEVAYRLCHQDHYGLRKLAVAEIMGIVPRTVNYLLRQVRKTAPQLFPVLPPKMAAAYSRFMAGYTTPEIAEDLGVSERHIRRILHWLWQRRTSTGLYFPMGAWKRLQYKESMVEFVKERW